MLGAMWSRERAATRAAAVAGSALLVLSATACTGEPEEQRQGSPRPTSSPTATGSAPALRERAAPYDIGYRRIAGSLPRRRSQDILRGLTRPVRVWVDRGFVDGPWPRERFRPAFGPFTSELAPRVRRDELLTLQRQGPELTSVVPQRRRVAVSATARGGRPVGATAHVDLRFLTVDRQDDRRRIRVNGDLYLTRTKTGWQIFGYDLDRRVEGPPGSRRAGAAPQDSQGGDA
jgi:hypothetical protein